MLKKKGGYNVEWVMEGNDVYDYVFEVYYDVLIFDWMMFNGDGIDVCKCLRKEGYVGVIFMLIVKDVV